MCKCGQIQVVTVSDHSKTSATPLSQFLKNDGTGFMRRPSFDLNETLGILPFSSGTTGHLKFIDTSDVRGQQVCPRG